MILEFLKITPEAGAYIYALSYIFIGTTSLFLLTRKAAKNKPLYLWLFLWGVFYGAHELLDLIYSNKGLETLEIFSSYTELFAYYFLSNLMIFGIRKKEGANKNTKIFISLFILALLFFFKILYSRYLFLMPSLVSLYISIDFFKLSFDKKIYRNIRKYTAILSFLFLMFAIFTVFEDLHLHGNSEFWAYYVRIIRSIIGLLISLNLLFYFIDDLTPNQKPKYYKISRRFIWGAFLLFIFLFFFTNYLILKTKHDHHDEMMSYKKEDLEQLVDLYERTVRDNFLVNRSLANSSQVRGLVNYYYLSDEDKNQDDYEILKEEVYALFDSIREADTQRTIYVMDGLGNVLISSNRLDKNSFEGNNYSFRPYFQESIIGEESIFYAKGVTSGVKGAYYSSPIYSEDGGILAVLVIKIDEEEFFNHVVHDKGSFLLSPDGNVFASKDLDIIDKKFFVDDFTKSPDSLNGLDGQINIFTGFKELESNIAVDQEGQTYFYRIVDIIPKGWMIGFYEEHEHLDSKILEKIFYILIFNIVYIIMFYSILTYFIDTLILQINENKYRDIYNNSNDLIFSFNSSGNITFVNPAWTRNIGYMEKELSKINIEKTIYHKDLGKFKKSIKDVFAKNKKANLELRFQKKNGDLVWGIGSFEKEIRNDQFYIARGVFRNNTVEKKREKEIRKKNKELASLLRRAEKDKITQEKQRMATLNILEDVSETQEKLEKNNIELEKREEELNSLAVFSGEISNEFDIKNLVKKVKEYFSKNIEFDLASFYINVNYSKKGLFYSTYSKDSVSKIFYQKTVESCNKYLEKNYKKFGIPPKASFKNNFFGKFSKVGKDRFLSNIFVDLQTGKDIFGFISLASRKENAYSDDEILFIRTVVSNLSLAIYNIILLDKTQQSKTESLVRSLSDGIVMFNEIGEVLLLNPAAEEYTGVKRGAKSLEDFFEKIPEIKIKEMINDALLDAKTSKIEELEVKLRVKKIIFQVFITPIFDFDKKIIGAVLVMQDITHIKFVDRMKTEFVSVASHQLRTPLTAIKLFTEMLIREQVGRVSKEQKEYLSNVYDSTERMVGLVNDLLNVTRIESGRLMINPEQVDFDKFLSSLISEAKSLAEIKKVNIIYKKNKNLKKIPLDKSLVRQVYHNLLTNAIRYTPEKRDIVVSVKKNKEDFIVSVKDSGIGIPKDSQKRIFEKFFRADNAVKIATEGTGLGLYVSKMIIESSGGKIWFKSEQGKGTTFFASLPLRGMVKRKGERGLSLS